MEDLRNAVKHAREILAQKAFDPFRGDEMLPGLLLFWFCGFVVWGVKNLFCFKTRLYHIRKS